MFFSSASRALRREMEQAIMVAKPIDRIFGQPTTKTINIMMEQIVKWFPP